MRKIEIADETFEQTMYGVFDEIKHGRKVIPLSAFFYRLKTHGISDAIVHSPLPIFTSTLLVKSARGSAFGEVAGRNDGHSLIANVPKSIVGRTDFFDENASAYFALELTSRNFGLETDSDRLVLSLTKAGEKKVETGSFYSNDETLAGFFKNYTKLGIPHGKLEREIENDHNPIMECHYSEGESASLILRQATGAGGIGPIGWIKMSMPENVSLTMSLDNQLITQGYILFEK